MNEIRHANKYNSATEAAKAHGWTDPDAINLSDVIALSILTTSQTADAVNQSNARALVWLQKRSGVTINCETGSVVVDITSRPF